MIDFDRLRAHLQVTHMNQSASHLGDGEALDQHHHEHYGPGGIRNHDHVPEVPPPTLTTATLRADPGVTLRDDPWLTPEEIATELRVSKMTVYRLLKEEELTYTRVGRGMRVRRTELDRYIADNTRQRSGK